MAGPTDLLNELLQPDFVLAQTAAEVLRGVGDPLAVGGRSDEVPELPHAHPVVDGGADDADARAEHGANDRPVLGLLRLRPLLLVRVAHSVR